MLTLRQIQSWSATSTKSCCSCLVRIDHLSHAYINWTEHATKKNVCEKIYQITSMYKIVFTIILSYLIACTVVSWHNCWFYDRPWNNDVMWLKRKKSFENLSNQIKSMKKVRRVRMGKIANVQNLLACKHAIIIPIPSFLIIGARIRFIGR